ncbi:MAG: hypothetical protein EXR69_14030 [Myxococcales bacterium]|nr:hypothetical protein [Myxococcales bacterium]
MFRDDRNAMVHQVDSLSREADKLRMENQAMREQLLAAQRGTSQPVFNVYQIDASYLAPGDRTALSHHSVQPFPVWAAGLLHFVTFGIFSAVHFNLIHDRLPKAMHNDPAGAKAVGFSFIPFFNCWYWSFFSSMRLADRLNLQFRLRGERPRAPKGLVLASSILSVHPYFFLLIGWPILWTIAVCMLQSAVNRVAAMEPFVGAQAGQGATLPALDPYAQPPAGLLPGA